MWSAQLQHIAFAQLVKWAIPGKKVNYDQKWSSTIELCHRVATSLVYCEDTPIKIDIDFHQLWGESSRVIPLNS